MTTKGWGIGLLGVGTFVGFFRITTDPIALTVISFCLALAGLFLLWKPYKLKWVICLLLIPPGLFGLLSLIFVHKHIALSLSWMGVPVLAIWQLFREVRHKNPELNEQDNLGTNT